MSTTRHHMKLDIAGALAVPLREFRRLWKGCVRDDNGQLMTPEQFYVYLQQQQAKGHKYESFSGSECVVFDPFEMGCPGHPVEQSKVTNR